MFCVHAQRGYKQTKRNRFDWFKLTENLIRSFHKQHPDLPSTIIEHGADEQQLKRFKEIATEVISLPFDERDQKYMFIQRITLMPDLLEEWKWCMLLDADTLVRKSLTGFIELIDRPEPTMTAYHRPNGTWNCGVMGFNIGAKEVIEEMGDLLTDWVHKPSFLLLEEQDAWVQAAQAMDFPIHDSGTKYNDMPLMPSNKCHDWGHIWHAKSKLDQQWWKDEVQRILK